MSPSASLLPNGVDPTKNVVELVEHSIVRIDDLREAAKALTQAKIDIMEAKLAAVAAMADLRARHATELALAESKRLDSTREVDTLAARTRDDRAAAAVTALAASARTDAEVLRALVATTAAANATQLDQRLGSVNDRISTLEKSAATGEGRTKYLDPAQAEMKAALERLIMLQSAGSGRSEGVKASWGTLIGAVALLGGIIGIVMKLIP